jgi:hypothetical protein
MAMERVLQLAEENQEITCLQLMEENGEPPSNEYIDGLGAETNLRRND